MRSLDLLRVRVSEEQFSELLLVFKLCNETVTTEMGLSLLQQLQVNLFLGLEKPCHYRNVCGAQNPIYF